MCLKCAGEPGNVPEHAEGRSDTGVSLLLLYLVTRFMVVCGNYPNCNEHLCLQVGLGDLKDLLQPAGSAILILFLSFN